MKSLRTATEGFTLVELILVIAIISVLTSVVFVAIRPGKIYASTRNLKRTSDIQNIAKALELYRYDNGGTLPAAITTTREEICIE